MCRGTKEFPAPGMQRQIPRSEAEQTSGRGMRRFIEVIAGLKCEARTDETAKTGEVGSTFGENPLPATGSPFGEATQTSRRQHGNRRFLLISN
ncbi:UNVERIFIED_CONTAM: hypothetical protein Sangu_1522800 [Sesamum angustifolium]|uniref:Uncharacterized protein n=1 Tax=Sesamum angustifolium TaxID=2727405 RepID=A0AAW2MT22_9LAMI